MAEIINRGKQLIRISPKKRNEIEYSTNGGSVWNRCYSGSQCGDFLDLMDNGKEILGTTTKGLYYSTNEGRVWNRRKAN